MSLLGPNNARSVHNNTLFILNPGTITCGQGQVPKVFFVTSTLNLYFQQYTTVSK